MKRRICNGCGEDISGLVDETNNLFGGCARCYSFDYRTEGEEAPAAAPAPARSGVRWDNPPGDLQAELLALAHRWVQEATCRADGCSASGAPLWHGWALREAFLAGWLAAKEGKVG